MSGASTLFDKIWAEHEIARDGSGQSLIAIDRVFLHERTGAAALTSLAEAGRAPIAPDRVFVTMDHIVSNRPGRGADEARTPTGGAFITATREAAKAAGLRLVDVDDPRQGIVHVIAPELAAALPGLTLICPDSHTCSLGALGALAWGVGSSEAEHAIATGAVRLQKPPQMRVRITGALHPGVTAKDLALHIIAAHGAGGGLRSAIEFTGEAVTALSLEERLTLCNLAVEFAAFTAIIAPDESVFEHLNGRSFAPAGPLWGEAVAHWRALHSDAGAHFDHEIEICADDVAPRITWGTSPGQGAGFDEHAPNPAKAPPDKRASLMRALDYMGLEPGQALTGLSIDGAFIGSCTNGRLSDLRAAADLLRGRSVAQGVRAICVAGSQSVKRAAEAEGLDTVFREAGFEWGEPGCALCFYAGGETFAPGARVISSTNRNFEGRQGPGVRTHLASPATVAASAVTGQITDPRTLAGAAAEAAE
ncbi:MAG: 3-isopropylmalate dehydratase large subunit [Pseudomonadota bacterium]